MAREDQRLLICDLTQSYSPKGGGGISTYLKEKRRYLLSRTDHRLLQIVPGPEDRVVEDGRHIWVEIGSEQVRGSPNYRFILRTRKVREVLAQYRPDTIESLCPWILPWTAINHRRAFPETTLVAGYHTDFPNAHVYRVGRDVVGEKIAAAARWLILGYAEITYREFDRVYTLGEDARQMLNSRKLDRIDLLDLGVDTNLFDPARRDPGLRARLGLAGDGPLLTYAGRIDNEKRAHRLVEMFKLLPPELGAGLLMLGDGKLRAQLAEECAGLPAAFPGFIEDRVELAAALASSDIYVSAMADETFGISVIEAQASGLPVVGVAGGEMPARVSHGLGLLGPVDDPAAMARNVAEVWRGDCRAMGWAARAHAVTRYSWDRTFDRLFGEIYPAALAHKRRRLNGVPLWGPKSRAAELEPA
ncbi:MAG: glycosyltransferase [Candidatus Andeanibacterium colombiense]|uniref:Glycosyltransferase n=1 Tax=Candidatus Andeanibacterium colombiense TaxID=3121345 RepID=A0AAJ5X5B2_9SPHN|nr:MAG: glycosyltransferase [Sphingomonadaceae bacterium]